MEHSILSIIPPLLAVMMVILTRKVLLSLGTGILTSALLIARGNVVETGKLLWVHFTGIFVDDGHINTSNVYIIIFLLILGILTALINIMGGSKAFGEWALTKVKTRVGAKLLTVVLGIVIFIDDYFNALAVGQVARPITDRHKISRAKLAYLIDSTSAPICVVSPISSWGAFIIAIIGTDVIIRQNLTDLSAFTTFIYMIPMNLYVWATLALVFIFATRSIDFGAMKKHEEHAITTGVTFDPNKENPGELKDQFEVSSHGNTFDLLLPIIALFIGTIASIIWTGMNNLDGHFSIFNIFGEADVPLSLVFGGLFALLVAIGLFIKQSTKFHILSKKDFTLCCVAGAKTMLPAVYILLFAWTISSLIDRLGTGLYLAHLVENSSLSSAYLPVILFVVAGFMAFSTGTSWGSFGILLPIAGQIMVATDVSLLLPAMAAVLAGAVFGDHCSPISDTTILSATGAGCNTIDHVMTQLPYALIAAFVSIIGFIVLGHTGSTLLALLTVAVQLIIFVIFLSKRKQKSVDVS